MEYKKILQSVEYIRNQIKGNCNFDTGIILGSGLGDIAELIENRTCIRYEDIPYFPKSTVAGHAGQFVIGMFENKNVIVMQGRFHYYEGNKMEALTIPIYVMKILGVKMLIVTNAAGGVNTGYEPGDLMVIKDHVNLAFDNPLIGQEIQEIGSRFQDMNEAYDSDLITLSSNLALKLNIRMKQGIYFMVTGPSYETPAEIKMIRYLGGDAVGMSTIPEVIAAKQCEMKVLGISCITNMASGILNRPLDHTEVIETSNKVKDKFILLLKAIIRHT